MSATPDRWRSLEEIYQAALDQPPERRADFLRDACPDESLRHEVESLLGFAAEGDPLLQHSPWTQSDSVVAGTSLGTYVIEERIGTGGMGEVFLARDTKLNRPVAVKFLSNDVADPDARRRFQREAQLVSSLQHPHIVTVCDVGEFEGRHYLVTEYLDGGTLRQWLKKGRTWQQAVELLTGAADGLAAAHESKILHRDIKPENILLSKNGYAKLADFGLAKLSESAAVSPGNVTVTAGTRPGMVLGTPAYMSPEQAAGSAADARSDIFSLGVVLYEALSGGRPFQGTSTVDVLHEILHRDPAPLSPTLPPALRNLVEKAIEKDPADRYQSMRELVIDLRRLERRSAMPATPQPIDRPPARGWLIGSAAAGFLLCAAAALLFLASNRTDGTIIPKHTPFAVTEQLYFDPVWSPDGKAVAYTAQSGETRQVYMRYLDASVARQLTSTAGGSAMMGWSGDSKKVYFRDFTPRAGQQVGLMSVPVFGGDPVLVAAMPLPLAGVISGDGQAAALLHSDGKGAVNLLTSSPVGAPWKRYPVSIDGNRIRDVPGLSFSPDGKSILFLLDSDSRQIVLLPWPPESGTPRRILTSGAGVVGIGIPSQHSWWPDNRHLVLTTALRRGELAHLHRVNIDSGQLEPLTGGSGNQMVPSVSPDGKKIVYAEVRRTVDVVSASLADASVTKLIATERYEQMPAWSGQRSLLVYVTDRHGPSEIWMQDSEGNERPLVTESTFPAGTTGAYFSPALSPDGTRVVFTRVDSSQGVHLWISSANGGPPVRLTNTKASAAEYGGAWSPDGAKFVFLEISGGKAAYRIVKTNGEAEPVSISSIDASRKLASPTDPSTAVYASLDTFSRALPNWSPTGEWIACREDSTNRWALVSTDGARKVDLGEIRTLHLAFSKDGKAVYGIRSESSRFYLFSLDLESKKVKTIGEISRENAPGNYPHPGGVRFSLTPDGRSITYGTRIYRSSLWIMEGFPQPGRSYTFRLPFLK